MGHKFFVGNQGFGNAWGNILAPLGGGQRLVEQAQALSGANLWVQTITAFAVGLLLCGCSAKKEPEGEPVVTVDVAPVLNSAIFFFNDTAATEIYTLSLHYALPI